MAVLRSGGSGPEALLIQRTDRPDDPGAGQVSFPGGRREAGDASLSTTALRELAEEVGLTPQDLKLPLRFVGVYPARAFGLDVATFVTEIRPEASRPYSAAPEEVESVFWVPVHRLRATERIPRRTREGLLDVDASVYAGHVVWGFTRRVLLDLIDRVDGSAREAPSAPQGAGSPRIDAPTFKKGP